MANQVLVLGYWNCRGLAQHSTMLQYALVRLELEYLGFPYEEKKYSDMGEWFGGDNDKEPIKSHLLANLPYLIDGDRYIYESKGIVAYLALKANRQDLLGETPGEIVRLAQIQGVFYDLMFQFITINMNKAEFAEKGIESFKANVVPYLYTLNKFIDGRKFSVSDRITIADFHLYEIISIVKAFHAESLEQFDNLNGFKNTFEAIPQIDAYLKSDRNDGRPFYMSKEYFAWTG